MAIDNILQKARKGNGLNVEEIRILFQDLKNLGKASEIAAELKSEQKGDSAALYTCLYITNSCVNDCSYCGFGRSNKDLERITLTSEQILEEAKVIKDLGVSNVILIGSTLPEDQYKDLIMSGTKSLLELNLNPWIEFENLSPKTLREISEIGANHFVLFQETYNEEIYKRVHRRSPLKRDYGARLRKVDEAVEAGFLNVNIGTLYGLNRDYASEIVELHKHATGLKEKGASVCISVPTLKPAPGRSISPNRVSDFDIEKAYIILRLSLRDVSLALSGRENKELRNNLFPIIDQIGSGGVTNPGGRTAYKEAYLRGDTQFTLNDGRSPLEVTQYLATLGIKVIPQVKWTA